ncbi:MAG: ABC transporter substrate-binding protein [Anaerolineae bacterium]
MSGRQGRGFTWWPLALGLGLVAFALLQMAWGAMDIGLHLGRDEVWDEVRARGILRVGMEASYPPFESVADSGELQGFDIDLARSLGERWGVDVQFVDVHYDGLVEALAADKFDLIISALPYDARLTRDVAYSDPYVYLGLRAVSRASDGPVSSMADLDGRVVGVELGSEAHQYLRLQMRDHGLDVEVRAERTLPEAVEALRQGEVSAVVCDRVDAAPYAREAGLVGGKSLLTSEPVVIGVPTDAPVLLREVNSALETMRYDGTLAEIEDRWF